MGRATVEIEDILLGVLEQPDGIVQQFLAGVGVTPASVRGLTRDRVGSAGRVRRWRSLLLWSDARRMLALAERMATVRAVPVGVEPLLAAMPRPRDRRVCQIVRDLGVDPEVLTFGIDQNAPGKDPHPTRPGVELVGMWTARDEGPTRRT
jgi:hypothetical protein